MLLLAQLNAPALQPGPVRLPAPVPMELLDPVPRIQPQPPAVHHDLQPKPPLQPTPVPPAPAAAAPAVQGFMPYRRAVLAEILAPCSALAGLEERLQACAAALAARLFSDGYINTRVLPRAAPEPGFLEIQQGRIERIDVISSDPSLQRRVQRLIQPLQGGVLHLPSLTARLGQVQRLPGVGLLRSSLNRVARDSTRAVLLITVQPSSRSLRGDISLRNEGNPGSGQFRGVATLLQQDLLKAADSLLLSTELDADSDPELGYSSAALSYRLPLNDQLSFTAAAGISRRSLVEAEPPIHDLAFRQQQLLGQFDFTLHEGWAQRFYAFAGISVNRIDAFLAADRVAVIAGGGEDAWLRSGYARFGIGYEHFQQALLLDGSVYGLQAIDALTPVQQRQELDFLGINLNRAGAIGSQWSLTCSLAPGWLLQLRTAAQLAFQPLPNAMGFSLGSDSGLRGLPGQAISGDSGVLGSAELAWQFWRGERQALQVVPFLGAGRVWTELPGATLSDAIGAGGLLVRWTHGPHHVLELGWVKQFQAESRAFWDRWILGSGIYTKLVYRF
jgi:hemolysin activation/secretion protein